MSEAACKTILCSGGARAAIRGYVITREYTQDISDAKALALAVNAAEWELQNAVEVTHLLAEQKFKIRREDAYQLIESIDQVEQFFAGQNRLDPTPGDVIAFLNDQAHAIHAGILALHLAVTGEPATYGTT